MAFAQFVWEFIKRPANSARSIFIRLLYVICFENLPLSGSSILTGHSLGCAPTSFGPSNTRNLGNII